jgi:flagellar hook-length control protein FliK
LALAQQTEQARQQPSTQEVATEATKVQIQVMPAPTPAAVWMMRNTLAVTAPKQEQFQKSGISWSELDLTDAASPQLLESLEQAMAEGGSSAPSSASSPLLASTGTPAGQRPDLSAAARQDLQNQAGGPGTEDAGPAQRSENIQNLAEKMGQAVGQRILSEIEKGQWHLKLSLRPATLGHIEVEMRMRSGELDAVFTAPQAVTRELLQDGLSKLKDTLNQMGMDVASMLVGDGQKQKRGGDSTPEQMSKSKNDNSVDSGSSPLTGSAPIHHMKMGQDGWDVLV